MTIRRFALGNPLRHDDCPYRRGPHGLSGLFGQFDDDVGFQGEPAASSRDEPNIRTFLFHPLAQEDEPGFQVIFELGKAKPGIQTQFAVGKLRPTFVPVLCE